MCLDLHLDHLQRASQHAAQDVGVPELVLRPAIVWKLHKIGKGVVIEHQGELVVVARPICDLRRDV